MNSCRVSKESGSSSFLLFIFMITAVFTISACSLPNIDPNFTASNPISVNLTGTKSIFLIPSTGIMDPNSSRSVALSRDSQEISKNISRVTSEDEHTLIATLDEFGNTVPVQFQTTTGESIVLIASEIFMVGQNLGAVITGEIPFADLYDINGVVQTSNKLDFDSPITIFILASNGGVYDFTGYDLKNSLSDESTLYVIKSGVAYAINYSNFSQATPLNNSTVIWINRLNFISGTNIIANVEITSYTDGYYRFDNIGTSNYLLDGKGVRAPRLISEITMDFLGNNKVKYGIASYQIRDLNGIVWGFFTGDPPNLGSYPNIDSYIFRIDCSEENGTTSVPSASVSQVLTPDGQWSDYRYVYFRNYHQITNRALDDEVRTIWRTSGVILIMRQANGISMEFFPSPLIPDNFWPDSVKRYRVSDNEFVWIDPSTNTTVYYLQFDKVSHNFLKTVLLDNADFISSPINKEAIQVLGRRIYYTVAQGASGIANCYIDLDDATHTPVVCSENSIPVSQVLMATF